ncbi:MAG TPA: hypothetical protein VKS82_14015 [Streptosporangiaceae bacterium]|jgi:hypothetical protein|nr:hypothetical protein [Streptosporangiaceae bacterium]
MACNLLTDPTGCLGPPTGGQPASPTQGWDAICVSFAHAAQQLLASFASSLVSVPPLSLSAPGVRSAYGLSLVIAGLVAAVLLMFQVIRTVLTHDGSAMAHGLAGIGKAVLAFALTLGVAATALRASDDLTSWIVARTFGTPQALSAKLSGLISFNPRVSASLLFILALLGILVTVALWGQLLLRNAAVALLVAISPVAAAGQVGSAAAVWWRKLTRTALQLIVLKPMVALILALGLSLPGTSGQVERLLSGMVVLLIAACAWPAMARVSAVMEVHVSGGFLAGIRTSLSSRVTGGTPAGVNPAELSRVAENRTISALHEFGMRTSAALPGGADGPRPWPQGNRLPGSRLVAAGAEGFRLAFIADEEDAKTPERSGAGPIADDAATSGGTT